MHASIYTESNTLPPLIIISQVHFMNLEATPLLTLDSLTRRSASINIPLQPNFTCPQTSMQVFLTLYYHAAKSTSLVWKPHPFWLLIPLLDGAFLEYSIATKFYVPSNMHASIFTESNTLPPTYPRPPDLA